LKRSSGTHVELRVWHGIGARDEVYYGEDRIHQFVRAIESFLSSDVKGAKEFSENVSEVVEHDPWYTQDKLKQRYNLRSASEHHFRFEEHERFQSISGISVAMAESPEQMPRIFVWNSTGDFLFRSERMSFFPCMELQTCKIKL
jgi:hypothetical protein